MIISNKISFTSKAVIVYGKINKKIKKNLLFKKSKVALISQIKKRCLEIQSKDVLTFLNFFKYFNF